jgi:hypothetical protein
VRDERAEEAGGLGEFLLDSISGGGQHIRTACRMARFVMQGSVQSVWELASVPKVLQHLLATNPRLFLNVGVQRQNK